MEDSVALNGKRIALAVGGFFVAFIVLLFVLIPVTFGGTFTRTEANEWGCVYGKGMFDTRDLKTQVKPGSSGGFHVWDKFIKGPSDDRYYFVDDDPNTADYGGRPITAPAKGTTADSTGIVQVTTQLQVRFVINENFCDLYNEKLRRAEPLNYNSSQGEDSGWARFLNNELNQALISASRPLVAPYDYKQLYQNIKVTIDGNEMFLYDYMEQEFSKILTTSLQTSLGGTFFCGPSYVFDGKFDGEVESCPPIEITVKAVTPVDTTFLDNLTTVTKNQEQQRVIESDRQRAIAQTQADTQVALAQATADQERALAKAESDKQISLAQTQAALETEAARIAKDLAIAQADTELATVQTANAEKRKEAETKICRDLQAAGVDCADYFRALNWNPSIILGEDGEILLDVPAPAG